MYLQNGNVNEERATAGPSLAAMKFVAGADFVVLIAWAFTWSMAVAHWLNLRRAAKRGMLA